MFELNYNLDVEQVGFIKLNDDVGSSTDAVQLNEGNFIIGSYIHDFPDNMVYWQNSWGAIMFNLFKNIGNAALNLRNRSFYKI